MNHAIDGNLDCDHCGQHTPDGEGRYVADDVLGTARVCRACFDDGFEDHLYPATS
jgi:hypothetical protein